MTMTGHPLEKIKKDMHRPASAIRGGRIVAGIAPRRYVHAGLATSTSAPTRPCNTASSTRFSSRSRRAWAAGGSGWATG